MAGNDPAQAIVHDRPHLHPLSQTSSSTSHSAHIATPASASSRTLHGDAVVHTSTPEDLEAAHVTEKSTSTSAGNDGGRGGGDDDDKMSHPPKAQDPNEVTFDGPSDTYDPLTQPTLRKWIAVGAVSSGAVCVTCASSMASSTYTGIETDLGISKEVAILTVSLFVAGLGLGPLLLGPLSEFVGRKPVYITSFALFTLLNLPVALAPNVAVHMIFRFLTGFVGSAFLSVAGGTVTDLFTNDTVGTPMAIYSCSPFLGPVLGPLIAGFINENASWRVTFYVVIAWSAVETLILWLACPETFRPQVLKIKARRMRKETGNDKLYAPIERSDKSIVEALKFSCKTPFKILATEYMAVSLNLWTALLLGILYLFFNAYPLVFEGNHGFSLQQTGLTFLGIGIGEIIGAACTPIFSRIYAKQSKEHGGKAPPEARLVIGMVGAILVPIGLFWFGATTQSSVHWIVPIIGSIPFGTGVVFVFSSVFTYLVDAYRPVAASAMASNSFMRSSFAAGFPLFALPMYNRLGTVGASCLLAGLTLLMMPLPFIFYRIGARVRERSKFGAGGDQH